MTELEMFLLDTKFEGYPLTKKGVKQFYKDKFPEWKARHDFIVKSHNEHCENLFNKGIKK